MTAAACWRRLLSITRARRQQLRRDEGTSLVELMVAMTLMTVFLAMFTGAIIMMNSAMNKSQAVNLGASQLNGAFADLDKMVRYAASISTPKIGAAPSNNWYVELRVTTTGGEVCNQLRVDKVSSQLQLRTWSVVNAVASAPGPWVPIASGISNGGAAAGPTTQPFYLIPPVGSALFQQLTINLVSPAGAGSTLTNSASSFTFTALNSPVNATGAQVCQQQGQP